jgi:hypothetical protein
MSYFFTWLWFTVGSIIAHMLGWASQYSVGIVTTIMAAAFFCHWLSVKLTTIENYDPPEPELHDAFVRQYFNATGVRTAKAWEDAARAAKRWENAMSKRRPRGRVLAFWKRAKA